LSHEAAAQVKLHGKRNDLITRLKADKAFRKVDFKSVLNAKSYIGRSPQQVDEFVTDVVTPIRRRYRKALNKKVELKV
ncbi:MAG: adenylosuccinate lyase, partial [Planctomycetes bacterium]|nr:adenylosuccinate lyase [Planctomycetota bacterium]